ncbi:MAG: M48 family peptidase, partial [Gammaproteobacteria bacterium]
MNLFSYTFLTLLFCSLTLQFYLIFRHLRHVGLHREKVPEEFTENISLEAHQKAADYTQAKSRIGIIDLILSSALLLIWTLGGGFNFIDQIIRGMTTSELWTGVCFMLSVLILSSLLDIPMSIYRTFILEEKFGFNKTTPKIFISDMVKSFILMIIIGTPMLALILWIMTNAGDNWWLYVWMTWLGFCLFMMWFYPEFIAPMFNKFKPLENQELKSRIESLLVRNGFASQGIF